MLIAGEMVFMEAEPCPEEELLEREGLHHLWAPPINLHLLLPLPGLELQLLDPVTRNISSAGGICSSP